MKKALSLIFILFFANLYALNLDIAELKKGEKIEFVNYQGKGRNDSTSAVRSIGYALAKGMKSGNSADFMMKYSIIRVISTKEPDKISAEIFSIHKNAQVDHVNNIRKILSAYFERRFGYSKTESDALAVFETYYNAYYRGNIDYLSGIYKSEVMKKVKAGNAGLATKWYEWPGATKIFIPLTVSDSTGELASIEPSAISDKKVISEMRKDDSNIEARKTVADMKEKDIAKEKEEAAKEKVAAAEEKKTAQKEKETAAKERKNVEAEKKAVAAQEKKVEEKKKEAAKITNPEERKAAEAKVSEEKKAVENKKQEVAKKEDAVKKQEETANKKTEDAAKKEDTAAKKEQDAARKEEALKEEKKDIATDELKRDVKKGDPAAVDKLQKKEEELNKKEEALAKKEEELKKGSVDRNVIGDKMYYLKIREFLRNGHYNNDLCMIDAANRKVLFNSPVPNISGSRYDLFSGGIVVITRVDYEYTQHRLTLINKDTLKEIKTGKDNIFYRSFIEIRDGFIYAIVNQDGQSFLGRFDKDLVMTGKSSERISEDTFITFYGDYVYINSEDKKILVLKKDDLSYVDKIDPAQASNDSAAAVK